MICWEYKVTDDLYDSHIQAALTNTLYDLGREGWELVAVIRDPVDADFPRSYKCFFKRPLSHEPC